MNRKILKVVRKYILIVFRKIIILLIVNFLIVIMKLGDGGFIFLLCWKNNSNNIMKWRKFYNLILYIY